MARESADQCRYGAGVRFCAPRNMHSYELGAKPYEKQHVTHNGAFYPKWDSLPLGFENQVAAAHGARASWLQEYSHRTQTRTPDAYLFACKGHASFGNGMPA